MLRRRLHALFSRHPGRSLRFQVYSHLLLVFLIAVGGILAISTLSYLSFQERERAQQQALLEEHYRTILPRLEAGWQAAAAQARVRLEFARIVEEPDPVRWPKLVAYLNAQWSATEFSNLVLLGPGSRVLFRYGSEAATLEHLVMDAGPWLYAPEFGRLYRVFRLPVWLGGQGEGQLVLLKSVNNSVLRDLIIPQTQLVMKFGAHTVAESREEVEQGMAGPGGHLRAEISWPRLADETRPVLLAYREWQRFNAFSDYVIRPVGTVLFIVLLLWLSLGRWLTRIAGRVEVLGSSARLYAAGSDRAALHQALAPARARADEIGTTAQALERLIETIEIRDRDQRSYVETLSLLEEAVIELTPEGCILRASPGWNRLTHQNDTLGHQIQEYVHPDDVEVLQAQCRAMHTGEKSNVVLRLRLRPAGRTNHESWLECRLLCHTGDDGRPTGVRGVLRDITQTYLHEKQITHMALHDALTSLPNRVLLEDRIKVALRLASRTEHYVGVCFIDLDHFKMVNDSLGHKAGDRLLVAFAELLRTQLRVGDTLARWGGDEFVLLLPDMASERAVREVADKINAALAQPLDLDGSDIRVTFSLGAAIYPLDGEDVETLFSHADRAMFNAKAQGRNQICFFRDMASKDTGKKELYIQNRLASAIQARQIQAWYQPIVDARSGRCIAAEVLARWQDASYGWVSPATFIPMAENLGMIHELGHQILIASLDALSQWRAQGWPLQLAVNVSKRQLFIRSFPDTLLEAVRTRGLTPADLILEVTEGVALADVENGADRLQELEQAGFAIAIDDFGTGYSSLSQLHEIHADELKIDISFVRRLDEPGGLSMAQAIVNLARTFGLKTVAEGVEDAQTVERLRQLGVDSMQGYHFGKPMPQAEFQAWLARHAALV